MSGRKKTPPLDLKAIPAVMGWAITVTVDGETYVVETGLATVDARIKYWNRPKNRLVILAAIEKAKPLPKEALWA